MCDDDDPGADAGEQAREVSAPMPPAPPTTSARRSFEGMRLVHVSYLIGGIGRLLPREP